MSFLPLQGGCSAQQCWSNGLPTHQVCCILFPIYGHCVCTKREGNAILGKLWLPVLICFLSRSTEGHELQFATNHLGPFLLTNMLLPLLRAAPAARWRTLNAAKHLDLPGWWQSLPWLTRPEPSFLTTSASTQLHIDLLRSLLLTHFTHFSCQMSRPPWRSDNFAGLRAVKACKHSLHKGTSKASR